MHRFKIKKKNTKASGGKPDSEHRRQKSEKAFQRDGLSRKRKTEMMTKKLQAEKKKMLMLKTILKHNLKECYRMGRWKDANKKLW